MRGSEEDKKFFQFALEQSAEYPTLNRWIELQTRIRKLSDDVPGGGGGGAEGEAPPVPSLSSSGADSQVADRSSTVAGKRWGMKRKRLQVGSQVLALEERGVSQG